MALKIDIDCPDAMRVAHDYEQVGERCTDLRRPFREAAELMEQVHQRGFARLRGRYVLTGATKASLTGSGAGAIRNANRDGLVFGTSVSYAVLFFPDSAQREIPRMLLDYIVDPFGDEA
jgi:hypothetical protein